jgi:glutaredoxin-related protein
MPNAIDKYISCLQEEPEIVTASVLYQGGIHRPRKRFISILNDVWSYVSCHSVGCLFKKNLHEKYGMYSNRFPIAADQYFLKKAIVGGVKIIKADFIAGEFGLCGVSSTDLKGHLSETFRVQYETENNKNVQFFLYLLRLVKNKLIGKF